MGFINKRDTYAWRNPLEFSYVHPNPVVQEQEYNKRIDLIESKINELAGLLADMFPRAQDTHEYSFAYMWEPNKSIQTINISISTSTTRFYGVQSAVEA